MPYKEGYGVKKTVKFSIKKTDQWKSPKQWTPKPKPMTKKLK